MSCSDWTAPQAYAIQSVFISNMTRMSGSTIHVTKSALIMTMSYFNKCLIVARNQFESFRQAYGQPAMEIFLTTYETHPITTTFVATFLALSILPVFTFIALSLFILSFFTFATLSCALMSLVTVQLTLVLAFVVVLMTTFILSSIITILAISAHLLVRITATLSTFIRDLRLPDGRWTVNMSPRFTLSNLGSEVSEGRQHVAGWAATTLGQAPQISIGEWASEVPVKNWTSGLAHWIAGIDWRAYLAQFFALLGQGISICATKLVEWVASKKHIHEQSDSGPEREETSNVTKEDTELEPLQPSTGLGDIHESKETEEDWDLWEFSPQGSSSNTARRRSNSL